jgi:DNA-binding MarR family transcriptional regulator
LDWEVDVKSRAKSEERDPRSAHRLDELLGDSQIGHEGRAATTNHAAVKTWLRLLSCTTQIETEIRRRLRLHFDMTLPRFDYLAQLHRFHKEQPEGLRMNALSRYLMVTGGNVTGLTDELERDGLVAREASPDDRRAWIVRLTTKGRRAFEAMAHEHEQWILEMFAGLDARTVQQLYTHLGALRVQLVHHDQPAEEKA